MLFSTLKVFLGSIFRYLGQKNLIFSKIPKKLSPPPKSLGTHFLHFEWCYNLVLFRKCSLYDMAQIKLFNFAIKTYLIDILSLWFGQKGNVCHLKRTKSWHHSKCRKWVPSGLGGGDNFFGIFEKIWFFWPKYQKIEPRNTLRVKNNT